MIDSLLSIPDAESLPLYRMVLKLAGVWLKKMKKFSLEIAIKNENCI
jgi:hypothetical protein